MFYSKNLDFLPFLNSTVNFWAFDLEILIFWAVTSRDVTSKDVTSKDVTSKEVTSKDVTSKDVTSKFVTSKNCYK